MIPFTIETGSSPFMRPEPRPRVAVFPSRTPFQITDEKNDTLLSSLPVVARSARG